eukprot:gb/GFBE01074951.1/.p1 GENE.gb/GFBE01074951.1/~~gb/GFBE01074951.1/.p1  ORF type:complete len:302 (+),score=61.54 gb/GFBE01074951.1/:1-906(+)
MLRPLRDAQEVAPAAEDLRRQSAQPVREQLGVVQQAPQLQHQPQKGQLQGYSRWAPEPAHQVQFLQAQPQVQSPTGDPLLWCLSVVWARNRDIRQELPVQDLTMEYQSTHQGSSIALPPMVFGRTDFEGWLRKLIPSELMSCVSRKHFEIVAEVKPEAMGDDASQIEMSPWGPRLPCSFRIQNHSRNVIGVGGETSKVLPSNHCMELLEDDLISLCICEQENVTPWEPFLIFRFQLCNPEDPERVGALRDITGGALALDGKMSLREGDDITLPPPAFFSEGGGFTGAAPSMPAIPQSYELA